MTGNLLTSRCKGELGHVTRRLLARFLRAMSDRYITVRCQACEAAGYLRNPGPDVISGLYDCLAKDGSAKVRLAALRGKLWSRWKVRMLSRHE